MSTATKNINKEILALFSGQAAMVTTPKLYVELTGNHSLAVVLNQCVFWSNKSASKDGWFHKEYQEWFDETHVPERTLRRRFDKLEQHGWITTKVKKIGGINVKHIYTHTERIIDAITNMLHPDCPDRPECPNGAEIEQPPCTEIAPTGQGGRLETAKVADSSIYTDENLQKKTTNCESSSSFPSQETADYNHNQTQGMNEDIQAEDSTDFSTKSDYQNNQSKKESLLPNKDLNCDYSTNFVFSQTIDRNILQQKLSRDTRTDEDFLEECVYHVDHRSDNNFPRLQRAGALVKLLKKLKGDNVIFYAKPKEGEAPAKKAPLNETDEQRKERQFFEYELIKERENPEYISKALQQFPDMRAKYAK